MTPDEKLEAVGRIMTVIKEYRFNTGYSGDIFESSSLDNYLEVCLSKADFNFWRLLYSHGNAQYLYN